MDVTFTDGTSGRYDLVVGADGINSRMRQLIGITTRPRPVGMSIFRVVAQRPPEMDCAEVYYGGPRYKAGYSPISPDQCYAYLLDENLDASLIGPRAPLSLLRERGAGYGGTWGRILASLPQDTPVDYRWIEAILVDEPWYRGRTVIIGDAAHACPPLIAQGAAMCAEDAVVLAELVTGGAPWRRRSTRSWRAGCPGCGWCWRTRCGSPTGRSIRRRPARTPAGSCRRPWTI